MRPFCVAAALIELDGRRGGGKKEEKRREERRRKERRKAEKWFAVRGTEACL